MAQKAGVIFERGDELRMFMRGRNHRVENWLNDNCVRLGLEGAVHPTNLSRALIGRPSSETLVQALRALVDEIRADPWEWCKPPARIEDVEGIQEYATYGWWYDLLDPTIPFSRFERMPKHPLNRDEAEFLQERLSDWSTRLKGACDQYKADHALVRALMADDAPEYQSWGLEDSGWRLGGRGQRHRVGNSGLHGRTPDEIGLALALSRAALPLPFVKEARLAYDRPSALPVGDYISDPVEPWNGQEFEGVEWDSWEDNRRQLSRPDYLQVEHKVVYHWDGQRYQSKRSLGTTGSLS